MPFQSGRPAPRTALVVFVLTLSNAGILVHALLHHFGKNSHLGLQFSTFRVKDGGIEKHLLHRLEVCEDFSHINQQLIDRRHK
ncbi:hypothetical protein [Desulfofarcimen acetoxidans]|uniref:hypothetical protein n=1 Tax=Desulfofarcimen acetoxidans TaxID=58138 RepID=UPI0012FF2001|nr:hypothetical protein [Desulfofarcimen acetoxidans]